ncbi:hypothetical protein [Neisseria canis]|uniref:Uncharacterized protein n=1 Tax=Neisseria canis TaxID=493 RepID=A0A448DAH1_9NEIS|nr:hypothetical protein [Neisseria canis]OSI12531.1 hypothetical protein BWD07_05375 [Neisseria canis]VEF02928.1 Uncharacterised protein [Neisseria canis]
MYKLLYRKQLVRTFGHAFYALKHSKRLIIIRICGAAMHAVLNGTAHIAYKDFKITPHYLCSEQCRLKRKFQTALERKFEQRVRASHTLRMEFRFYTGYGLLLKIQTAW